MRSAAERMGRERVGALVVVEAERPVGMLTDRDLAVRVVAEGRDAATTRVADVASRNPVVLPEDLSLKQAALEMSANGARRMPVVDSKGHVVGLFAADDLVRLAARELTALADVAAEQSPHGRRPSASGVWELRDAAHYAKHVTTVEEATPVRDVGCTMRDQGIGCVVVVDTGGRPVGVLTDRDVARRVVGEGRDPVATTAAQVMSGAPLCLEATEQLQRVVDAMSDAGVRRIPIVRDGRLSGIVTYDDVLVALGDELHALGEAAQRARGEPLGGD